MHMKELTPIQAKAKKDFHHARDILALFCMTSPKEADMPLNDYIEMLAALCAELILNIIAVVSPDRAAAQVGVDALVRDLNRTLARMYDETAQPDGEESSGADRPEESVSL